MLLCLKTPERRVAIAKQASLAAQRARYGFIMKNTPRAAKKPRGKYTKVKGKRVRVFAEAKSTPTPADVDHLFTYGDSGKPYCNACGRPGLTISTAPDRAEHIKEKHPYLWAQVAKQEIEFLDESKTTTFNIEDEDDELA